ncbi:MAG: response regulator [Actinobacteria bacterium]|nr:response regulator [Actinomycetota bacterium]
MQRPNRILVADDDPSILRLLQLNFELEGFEVHTASDGEEALAKARSSSPDIVVLDVMMPGMDGWEVCRRLKEDETMREIPVILLTALGQEKERRRGVEAGAAEYVQKPFDPDELVRVVNVTLAGAGRD